MAPDEIMMRPARRPVAGPTRATPSGRHRRGLVSAVAIAVTTALGWWLLQVTASSSGPTAPPPPDSPSTTAGQIAVDPARPDVEWRPLAGLPLPVSRTSGPRCLTAGRAACFSHDQRGAAFAAVHLMVRTFPFAGSAVFGPTIREQVVGRHAAALARLTAQAYQQVARAAGVGDGAPVTADGGWVAGYRADRPEGPDARSIRVLIRQTDDGGVSGFTEYSVALQWRDGDWRLVAPAWGDWRTCARAISSADPDQYSGYDQTGRP